MTAALVCPACHEVVLADIRFGYTWLGDRKKWTHAAFGLLHLCDRTRRAYVAARDPRPIANPPWVRFLWRHRVLRPLAERLPTPEFLPVFHLEHHQPTDVPGEGAS